MPTSDQTGESRPLQIAVWGILGLVILLIGLFYVRFELMTKSSLPVLSELNDFSLTNQFGELTTLADLKGSVWVADIIFTRCGGPCPRMTEKMSALQKALPNKNIHFLTLTTDPDFDKPAVLKAYAEKFGADPGRWLFLTGSKDQIKQLATSGLKLVALEKSQDEQENPNDLFIHTTAFVLLDKRGRVRGSTFESLEPGFGEAIVPAAKELARERAK
jgi:protein SCO1